MSWTTPKTNWRESDYFNATDYNRIKNNIEWIYDKTEELLQVDVPFIDMGADISTYSGLRTAEQFNNFLYNIYNVGWKAIGTAVTFGFSFSNNGKFATYDQLNIIESRTLEIKNFLDGMESGLVNKHLSFTLGQYNAIKV